MIEGRKFDKLQFIGVFLASPSGRGAPVGGGEGKNALSVTAYGGASSPKGGAKWPHKLQSEKER
jgi:hypothetical protein